MSKAVLFRYSNNQNQHQNKNNPALRCHFNSKILLARSVASKRHWPGFELIMSKDTADFHVFSAMKSYTL